MNNPAIEPVAKKYAELRYQLMPYTYTLAWEARDTGLPLMRAMWLHYPTDERARGLGNQFLWGRDLLVAPVFTKGATSRDVYLPKGEWYDWWTNAPRDGRADRDAPGRSGDDADLRARRRDHSRRSRAAVHERAGEGADDAQGVIAAPTASTRCTKTTASARNTCRGEAAGRGWCGTSARGS